MSDQPLNHSRFGQLLYRSLPDHYRDRDDGTMAQYLDVCGGLLDRINHALDTLHEDFLPGGTDTFAKAQPWTMPYTAKLYGAKLVSPDDEGRSLEVQNSIRWNKRKGTLTCIEEIVEAIGGVECILAEGRAKTIISARIGEPRLPAAYFGQDDADDAVLHPGNPVTSPVLGRTIAPELTSAISPDVEKSVIAAEAVTWRTPRNHGVPSVPNAFFDRSPRTLDFRKASMRGGQAHPSRVVLHVPPFVGFFPLKMASVVWKAGWAVAGYEDDYLKVQRISRPEGRDLVQITGKGTQPFWLSGAVRVTSMDVRVDGIVFRNSLEVRSGNLELFRSAVKTVKVTSTHVDDPYCHLTDSLVGRAQISRGVLRLEHATLLDRLCCDTLLASDSILTVSQVRRGDETKVSIDGFVRYSMVPVGFFSKPTTADLQCDQGTCREEAPHFLSTEWGRPGCYSVVRDSSAFAEFGAENLGALGCYNHFYFSRRFAAMKQKVADFLPFGMEAAFVEDPMLLEENLFGTDE